MQNLRPPCDLSFKNTKQGFKHLSNKQLRTALRLFRLINIRLLANAGPWLTNVALGLGLPINSLIKNTIFKQFCGGETIEDSTKTILKLQANGVGSILDYAVEGAKREEMFDDTAKQIMACIDKAVAMPDAVPFCVFKITGLARFSLLEKIADGAVLKAYEKLEWDKALVRINQICEKAFVCHQMVMVDAEESWIQPAIDDIVMVMMRKYNQQKAIVYNTYQLYRTNKLEALIADVTRAYTANFVLGAKLVRGAYMEKERKRALRYNYPSPIHADKASTDRDFNAAAAFCLDNLDKVAMVLATHNEESCRFLAEKMEQQKVDPKHPRIYFAQLLGMSDHITFNLAHCNFNVNKYVPYGPVKEVLPYLFRRAKENTSIAGQVGRELKLIKQEQQRRKVEGHLLT